MGHIKEPDGVDFVINGKPLTEKQKKAITELIQADKERITKQKARKSRTSLSKSLLLNFKAFLGDTEARTAIVPICLAYGLSLTRLVCRDQSVIH